jgi:hypothetical protein
VLVVVLVLENPDRFAIRLTEQISSIGLFAVTESQCTEDEHDDDSKFRNLGSSQNVDFDLANSEAAGGICLRG